MNTQEKTVAVGTTNQRLKPERIQDGLAVRKTLRRLKVMRRLDDMPGWKLAPDGWAIGKARALGDPEHAAAYAAFAVQLAVERRQPLRLSLSHSQLVVTLHSRSGRGITGPILDLAAELG